LTFTVKVLQVTFPGGWIAQSVVRDVLAAQIALRVGAGDFLDLCLGISHPASRAAVAHCAFSSNVKY
jgi:hypothetical protein